MEDASDKKVALETLRKKLNIERTKYDETFFRYVFTLQSGGLIALGKMPNPLTSKVGKNLEQAREIISILSMLKEKTKDNLSNMENKILENILGNLQMSYVSEIVDNEKDKKETKLSEEQETKISDILNERNENV